MRKWEIINSARVVQSCSANGEIGILVGDRVHTLGGGGSGGLSVTDDGKGNVTINSTGTVSITDDGNGNVVIA